MSEVYELMEGMGSLGGLMLVLFVVCALLAFAALFVGLFIGNVMNHMQTTFQSGNAESEHRSPDDDVYVVDDP